jgi:hypothetical protein
VCLGIYPNLPKLFSLQCLPRTPFAVVATPDAQVPPPLAASALKSRLWFHTPHFSRSSRFLDAESFFAFFFVG